MTKHNTWIFGVSLFFKLHTKHLNTKKGITTKNILRSSPSLRFALCPGPWQRPACLRSLGPSASSATQRSNQHMRAVTPLACLSACLFARPQPSDTSTEERPNPHSHIFRFAFLFVRLNQLQWDVSLPHSSACLIRQLVSDFSLRQTSTWGLRPQLNSYLSWICLILQLASYVNWPHMSACFQSQLTSACLRPKPTLNLSLTQTQLTSDLNLAQTQLISDMNLTQTQLTSDISFLLPQISTLLRLTLPQISTCLRHQLSSDMNVLQTSFVRQLYRNRNTIN